MYESFYKLSSRPFQLNPDPSFFYRSTGHKRAQAYMRYGLQQEQGFIVVTGDVGTGKTMLVNNLFREIDSDKMVAAKIVSTNLKDLDLLRLIAAEFDIPFERCSKATLLHHLENHFKTCRQEGQRVLLVIDEAQNLTRGALEELRMLSNFDFEGTPLVQSFLLGQREFRTILRSPGLEQLRQRVIAAYHLKPLTRPEVQAYIEHRMHKVGWANDPAIEQSAYDLIYQATGGVPRRINTLVDRVLLSCFLDEQHQVSAAIVASVCAEVEHEQGDPLDDEMADGEAQDRGVVPVAVVSAGDANIASATIEKLEDQVRNMQLTIDTLSSKIQLQAAANAAMMEATGTFGGKRQFPVWTTTFASIVGIVILISAVLGYWLTRH